MKQQSTMMMLTARSSSAVSGNHSRSRRLLFDYFVGRFIVYQAHSHNSIQSHSHSHLSGRRHDDNPTNGPSCRHVHRRHPQQHQHRCPERRLQRSFGQMIETSLVDKFDQTLMRDHITKNKVPTMEDQWREWTSQLLVLDPPSSRPSSLTPQIDPIELHMIETCILHWSEQQTVESVIISLDLLERLSAIVSATTLTENNGAGSESVHHNDKGRRRVQIYIIHAILKNWSSCMRAAGGGGKSVHHITTMRMALPLPSQVLKRIDRCLEITPGFFEPNIATYTMVLDGASHCPDPQERVVFSRNLVEWLWEQSTPGKNTTTTTAPPFSHNSDNTDHTEAAAGASNNHLRPTVVTFGALIKGLANSKSVAHAQEAEQWLRRLQQLYDDQKLSPSGSGHDNDNGDAADLRPNTVIYTAVIHAWANVGRVDRAEALLQEMYLQYRKDGNTDARPTLKTFNTVLSAWSKSSSPDAYESAFDLFNLMQELMERNDLDSSHPDIVTYNCLLSTIARRRTHDDAVERAESIMDMIFSTSSSSAVKPTKITYLSLFRILAASMLPDKAERAQQWLSLSKSKSLVNDDDLRRHIQNMASKVR